MDPTSRLFVEAAMERMTVDKQRHVELILRVPGPGSTASKDSSLVGC